MNISDFSTFYKNKKILITGHTGFKGSWMCEILSNLGAEVVGYSLEPPTTPSLFELLNFKDNIKTYIGDVRSLKNLKEVFEKEKPQIVIHMAAQPLVRKSYEDPVGTFETNVMGTVNVLECCRLFESVRSVVNVTTDKVYKNLEQDKGYTETDFLDGYDPYSNSKSCSELVTHSYINSFFNVSVDAKDSDKNSESIIRCAVSTCRAGNVIGGGDFAKDRIIPDCFRAAQGMDDICVRNPFSVRPYQHVLEPLFVYLYVAWKQYEDPSVAGSYNVGPDDDSCVNTGTLTDCFVKEWNKLLLADCEGNPRPLLKWINKSDKGPHEAGFLKLDCSLLKKTFGWSPKWDIETAVKKSVEWYGIYLSGKSVKECMDRQIKEYMECLKA